MLWVRDGEFTFHDSKLVPKPPGQRDRDVLREAVEEGRKFDLPIIVYCQLQYPAHELRRHPEWKARQANGEPINQLVCFNTPYTNVVKGLVAEMLTDYVRSLDPHATVDFNYHGSPPFSWEVGQTPVVHADNGDFVTGEAGLWAFGALSASFNAAWYRSATPHKPFQVAVQRGVRMYHDHGLTGIYIGLFWKREDDD